MLLSILRVFPMSTLVKCKGIREVADAMIPYTERHFQRLEDALQRTYALDFTLHAMNKALGGDDGFEDEGQALAWSIDTKGKHRAEELAPEPVAAAHRPDEGDAASDEGEDEEGGAAGWGSWGGGAEGDSGGEEEEAASRPARAAKTPEGKKKKAGESAASTGKRKLKGAARPEGEGGEDVETGGGEGASVVKKRKSLSGTAPATPAARKQLDVDDAPPTGGKSAKKSREGGETPGKGARSPVATRAGKTPMKSSSKAEKSAGSSVKKSKTKE